MKVKAFIVTVEVEGKNGEKQMRVLCTQGQSVFFANLEDGGVYPLKCYQSEKTALRYGKQHIWEEDPKLKVHDVSFSMNVCQ